jgi:nucleotide-binding universal stress UspA family protein
MLALRKILFPVDFSERGRAVAGQVAAMARHFSAQVTLMNVVQTRPLWYGDPAGPPYQVWIDPAELIKDSQDTLNSFLTTELEGVKTERVVVEGDAAEAITQYAHKEGIDLIMMPTHGYGPFRRLLLGSVAAKVLHDADCPVWTDVHEPSTVARPECRTIMCAVDLSEESLSAIRWASNLAAAYQAELYLVHAIPAAESATWPDDSRFRAFLIDTAREYIGELQKKAGTTAKVCIEGGKIAATVRDAALHHNADMIVMGQGSMHSALGGLRTNSYAIIREAPCPVVRI